LRVRQPVAAGGDRGLPRQQRMASTTRPRKRTSRPGCGEICDTRDRGPKRDRPLIHGSR